MLSPACPAPPAPAPGDPALVRLMIITDPPPPALAHGLRTAHLFPTSEAMVTPKTSSVTLLYDALTTNAPLEHRAEIYMPCSKNEIILLDRRLLRFHLFLPRGLLVPRCLPRRRRHRRHHRSGRARASLGAHAWLATVSTPKGH